MPRRWNLSLVAALAFTLVIGLDSSAALVDSPSSIPPEADVLGASVPTLDQVRAEPIDAVDTDSSIAIGGLESGLFQLTNVDRQQQGLAPVTFAPELLDVARERAAAQDPGGALSHYDATGQLVFVHLVGDTGGEYRLIGENLARVVGPEDSGPARAEEALMNSPTHRANILEPTFDRMAVGSVLDATGRVVFAEIFAATVAHETAASATS